MLMMIFYLVVWDKMCIFATVNNNIIYKVYGKILAYKKGFVGGS